MEKTSIRIWAAIVALILVSPAIGQAEEPETEKPKLQPKERYANTPDDLVPYARREPYKREFVTPLEYLGPGRLKPEPTDLDTVRIGFLVPLYQVVHEDVSMPGQYQEIGQHTLHGAQMAVEEANARGGYRGKLPYKLVVYNDPVLEVKDTWLWGPFSNYAVDLIYKEKVWAILTTVGGENTHILIREAAGPSAEGVVVALPYDCDRRDAAATAFWERYRAAYGQEPDMFAAYAYDGANLLIAAIRSAGLNRARIRDALSGTADFHGVTGEMRFDKTGGNTVPVRLGMIVRDRLEPVK